MLCFLEQNGFTLKLNECAIHLCTVSTKMQNKFINSTANNTLKTWIFLDQVTAWYKETESYNQPRMHMNALMNVELRMSQTQAVLKEHKQC